MRREFTQASQQLSDPGWRRWQRASAPGLIEPVIEAAPVEREFPRDHGPVGRIHALPGRGFENSAGADEGGGVGVVCRLLEAKQAIQDRVAVP